MKVIRTAISIAIFALFLNQIGCQKTIHEASAIPARSDAFASAQMNVKPAR